MEVKHLCPYGNDCETAKDNVITRCHFYMKVLGEDPQTGKEFDRWQCAITLTPLLLIENSNMLRGLQAATESFRNENSKTGLALASGISVRTL